jgi:transposase
MQNRIVLSAAERKRCLRIWQYGNDRTAAKRALILLRLSDGASYREIRRTCYVSYDLIATAKRSYRRGGREAVLGGRSRPAFVPRWVCVVVAWLTRLTPRSFGFFKSRWTCGLLALVVWEQQRIELSAETVRRHLHRAGYVWRRPRPMVGPTDPDHDAKIRQIRHLLATLPPDETAVFQDEVEVHLNPKIGAMWMRKGQQAQVMTPGNNVKRHLAGSLVWRSNTLVVSPPGTRRNTALFLAHLDDLRRRLRAYRKIHVICDNAAFHKSRAVRDYLARWGHRIQIYYLPAYAPETNPIERVWWQLHETITRNHRCATIEELLQEVYQWFATIKRFPIDASIYRLAA